MPLVLPRSLVEAAERRALPPGWVAGLPEAVDEVRRRWSLTVGQPFQPGGQTAWVAPARDHTGRQVVVVKVAWRHPEAAHEADGLRVWDGRGTVALHAADRLDDDTEVLLLERCSPGTPLTTRPGPEQDTVVAGLLRRLWQANPSSHRFRPLQALCDAWADEFERTWATGRRRLDPGLARAGIALFRSLPTTAERTVLLTTDLHAGNVLAARREQWLVIDPKPFVGDPTYDPLQHLLNCGERLLADPRGLVDRMAGLLDLDRERLGLWLFARSVQESPDWPLAAEVARRLAPA